jgi:uncharacterized protein YabN with tetrapyrrole methylase and pyrophosphatase domain
MSSVCNLSTEVTRGVKPATTARAGSLIVVGSGIKFAAQATLAAERAIREASYVFFAVADPWSARWVRSLNPCAEALPYPREATERREIYSAMVERIMTKVRERENVCAVFYGSPAVLTQPAHQAVRRAKGEGWRAAMLPGVSFLECLFADAGIDPGERGCHFVDAKIFVRDERLLDVRAEVVLSQLAFVLKRGVFEDHDEEVQEGLQLIQARLLQYYPANHVAFLYEAAFNPFDAPRLEPLELCQITAARLSALTTLYIPPYDGALRPADCPINPNFHNPHLRENDA